MTAFLTRLWRRALRRRVRHLVGKQGDGDIEALDAGLAMVLKNFRG